MVDFPQRPKQSHYKTVLSEAISASATSILVKELPSFADGTTVRFTIISKAGVEDFETDSWGTPGAAGSFTSVTRGLAQVDGGSGTALPHGAGATVILSNPWQIYDDINTALESKVEDDGGTAADLTVTNFIDLPSYADAAARDTALPTPAEGYTVILLDDGDSNVCFSVYDGSGWNNITLPGSSVTIYDFLDVNTGYLKVPVYADDTARDAAIGAPALGMIIWNTTADTMQIYTSGGWSPLDLGTVTPLASQTVPGKVELATDQEVIDRTDANGGNPLVVQPSQIDFATETVLTAGLDLSPGDLVGASAFVDDTVGIAAQRTDDILVAHGITTPLSINPLNHFAPIGGDKFVYLNYTAADNDTLIAQVVEIDTDTLTPTAGAAETVATDFGPNSTSLLNACVCKLDTDKFIVFYLLDSSATDIKYRVGTVSGTTITFGAEATFVTAGSTVATSNSFSADFISTDKGVFSFKAATTTDSKMIAFTVSGTAIDTLGTGVTPGTECQKNLTSQVKRIADDKYVLATRSGDDIYAQVCTLSGTTITAGTEANLGTTGSTGGFYGVYSPEDDVFLVLVANSVSFGSMVAATVSGTTPTAGSLIDVGLGGNGVPTALIVRSATQYVLFEDGDERLLGVTRSGTTLTQDAGRVDVVSGVSMMGVNLDSGSWLFMEFRDSTNLEFWIQGMSNNYIGVVQNTVSKGGDARVKFAGVDSNQSDLVAGTTYEVRNGGLDEVDIFITSADSIAEQTVVRAVSDTEILI